MCNIFDFQDKYLTSRFHCCSHTHNPPVTPKLSYKNTSIYNVTCYKQASTDDNFSLQKTLIHDHHQRAIRCFIHPTSLRNFAGSITIWVTLRHKADWSSCWAIITALTWSTDRCSPLEGNYEYEQINSIWEFTYFESANTRADRIIFLIAFPKSIISNASIAGWSP